MVAMETSANRTPTRGDADDVLHGLFISPLEDGESFDRMESEEAHMLTPPQPRAEPSSAAADQANGGDTPRAEREQEPAAPKSAQTTAGTSPEQVILRFAGELKSIKQDLLSIKQHVETLKKPMAAPAASQPSAQSSAPVAATSEAPNDKPTPRGDSSELLEDLRKLLLYLDRLLESLPEEKIEEFANSEYFNLYRHVFEKLGLS